MLYRQAATPGAPYFFTVIIFERRPILISTIGLTLCRAFGFSQVHVPDDPNIVRVTLKL